MTEQTDRELLEMAKESGLTEPDLGDWMTDYGDSEESIKRFAALVEAKAAAKEREACAQVCDDIGAPWDCEYPLIFQSAVDAYAAAIRARSTT